MITPSSILQISNNVIARSRSKLVEPVGGALQLGLLSTRNDDFRSILDKTLRCHFTKASGAASDKDNIVLEAEEVGDGEIGFG